LEGGKIRGRVGSAVHIEKKGEKGVEYI
jgi:hypothetical protein